ncbi:hypothetical protein P154DRAFT_529735 [Amniculicola lignicola CBS 123094]|uniref:RING-type domain-containing protein n=1 Tax=Amniculicola lignicola CBS 123094 TaxID=1392246 RepID=A0A6A5WYA0_9PLEO|nr:hypothetical protein P154DRAFT_529735 [Amniculicola lignicola CBS 123094]
MTAQSVGVFTIEFPDPRLDVFNDKFVTLGSNISFQYPITSNVRTLSTKGVERGSDPYGILYVPSLSTGDCQKSEAAHVPANATRLRNLPQDVDYALVAFAPWFSPTCMLEYFRSARNSPVKAFLVYQPGDSAAMPPIMKDDSWLLGDGGAWQTDNTFPTYALAPISGTIIMDQLSKYSGNVSDAPNGKELSELFKPSDYIRLWATVNTETSGQLPSLWVFLVIVLGILILVIISTSIFMHMIQRRRRNNLRQRVVNGEVDLERLGVKRLTVPRPYLEKLPLYTFSSAPTTDSTEKSTPQLPAQAHQLPSPTIKADTSLTVVPQARRLSAPDVGTSSAPFSAFSQPTCPICLDDFEPNETQVRELPCRHIFHPDCVDTFLLSNSSLCPMCKKSVLPSGYCPTKITNIMVRRERQLRRMRVRSDPYGATGTPVQATGAPANAPGRFGSLGNRIGGVGRRVFSIPERTRAQPSDIEMAANVPVPPPIHSVPVASGSAPPATNTQTTDCPTPHSRREWARQRALNLLGNNNVPADGEDETTPRWKRGLRKIFPGFR